MSTKDLGNAETGFGGLNFEGMLQECLACGTFTVDPEGRIIALSADARRSLNLAPAQNETLLLEALPLSIQTLVRETRKSGQAAVDRNIIVRSGDGAPVALSITTVPLATGNNRVAVLVLLKDLSSVGKLEYTLRRLNRLASVGTLSASMAHEIKNALVAVKTFVDLLLEKNQEVELAGIVRREMGRVDSIVTSMLKFSAPGPPTFATIHLHEIIDHSLRLVHHRTGDKLIAFDRHFNAASDAFSGDGRQMEQAFVNLLFNAVEAMGPEGSVAISTDLVSDEIELQLHDGSKASELLSVKITDSGAGIPPENITRIFEPFFTTKQSGTGLGLLVTRRIIEEHYGVIRVESLPGKGTTFTILLPSGAATASDTK